MDNKAHRPKIYNFAERTFFVTSVTWGRRSLFQSERAATLFLDTFVRLP